MAGANGSFESARQAAYARECLAYGYASKSLQWQTGFDRGFKEAWSAALECAKPPTELCDSVLSPSEGSPAWKGLSLPEQERVAKANALQAKIDALYVEQDELLEPVVKAVMESNSKLQVEGLIANLPPGFYRSELRVWLTNEENVNGS